MKILMVYTEKDNDLADEIRSLLETLSIQTESFPVKAPGDRDVRQFIGFFSHSGSEKKTQTEIPTHVLILSSLARQWFDFFAGFSSGNHLPFLVYGQDAIAGISAEFAFCFTFIQNEMSLQTFCEAENKAFKRQEAARDIIKAQETLLKMGVPVTTESLAQCAGEGRIREVSFFLAAGFSPDTRNKDGVPLLNIAARNGKREIIRFLALTDANLNIQAEDRGTSPLIDSVMAKHYDLMLDLVHAGVDVDIKSKDGQTALVVAVGAGLERMVEALLKAGADPDISDNMGTSARKYAGLFHKESMMALFEKFAPHTAPHTAPSAAPPAAPPAAPHPPKAK